MIHESQADCIRKLCTFSNLTRYVSWLLLGEQTVRTKSQLNQSQCTNRTFPLHVLIKTLMEAPGSYVEPGL